MTSSIYINELKLLWLRVLPATNTKQGRSGDGDGKDKYSDDSESDLESDKDPEPEPKPKPTSSRPATPSGSSSLHLPPPLLKRAMNRLRRRVPRAPAPDVERDVGISAVAPESGTLGDGTEGEKSRAGEERVSEVRSGKQKEVETGNAPADGE